MNDIIFEIIRSLMVIAIMVLVRYAVPYMKTKIKNSDLNWIYDWAVYAVEAAEQTITGSGRGAFKKQTVKDFLTKVSKDAGITLSDAQIENLIESAVYAMKQEDSK